VDTAARWPEDGTVDAFVEMDALSLRVCLIHLFGVDDPAHERTIRAALPVSADLYERASSPLRFALDHLPLPSTRRMSRQVSQIQGWVEERIRCAEREPPGAAHILAQMLAYRFDDNGPERMTREQVRDEMVDLIVGMHGVVSNALAYTVLLLAGAPAVQGRIRQEVVGALGPRAPALAELRGLPYTRRAVRESLRMYAPAWGFARMPTRDVRVGPYRIAKGSYVVISPAVTHRDGRYFPEPDRFDPDRWAPPKLEMQRMDAFIAFGAGQRSCIGEPLAMAELITMVAAIVPRVELQPVMDHPPRRKLRFANVPDEPLPVRVRRIGREREAA
jgi:pentalenene oxygenase